MNMIIFLIFLITILIGIIWFYRLVAECNHDERIYKLLYIPYFLLICDIVILIFFNC